MYVVEQIDNGKKRGWGMIDRYVQLMGIREDLQLDLGETYNQSHFMKKLQLYITYFWKFKKNKKLLAMQVMYNGRNVSGLDFF